MAVILSSTGMIVRVGSKLLSFSPQVQQRNELNERLNSTQARASAIQLEPLSSRKTELEQQLNQTKGQLDTVEAILSQPINKTATIGVLFTTAKAYGLEITKMTISGQNEITLEKVPASVASMTVTVEGDAANLIGFITKLNTLYTTGAVESAGITIPETTSGKKPWADIKLNIYTVQGR